MQVQEKLIAWRRYHGFTQKQVAEKLGIDVRTYINKEQGVTQFKANEMFLIAEILQKNISEIFLPPNFIKHEKTPPPKERRGGK
jgi:transcriptional regulator with XRE-family HTH domain